MREHEGKTIYITCGQASSRKVKPAKLGIALKMEPPKLREVPRDLTWLVQPLDVRYVVPLCK